MLAALESQRVRNLRESGQHLDAWIESMYKTLRQGSPVSHDRMDGLLSDLMCAGVTLRSIPAEGRGTELEHEVALYRQRLKALHELLPLLRDQLLLHRARLQSEGARLDSAAQWAHRSRQTL